jgi:pimeloyl-ACP methyl ester carboxylesterase
VIFVDWSKGAREINYLRAVANTRVVGAQVAQLLKILTTVYDVDPINVHIIGHSLGAHTAGYVGEYLDNIGRITGSD